MNKGWTTFFVILGIAIYTVAMLMATGVISMTSSTTEKLTLSYPSGSSEGVNWQLITSSDGSNRELRCYIDNGINTTENDLQITLTLNDYYYTVNLSYFDEEGIAGFGGETVYIETMNNSDSSYFVGTNVQILNNIMLDDASESGFVDYDGACIIINVHYSGSFESGFDYDIHTCVIQSIIQDGKELLEI